MTNKEQATELLNTYKEELKTELQLFGFPINKLSIKFLKSDIVVLIKGEIDVEKLSTKLDIPQLRKINSIEVSVHGRGVEAKSHFEAVYDKEGLSEDESTDLSFLAWSKSSSIYNSIIENYRSKINQSKLEIILSAFEGKDVADLIPEKIRDNYQISGDLSNIDSWKTKIVLHNSGNDKTKIGDYSEISYTMINLDTGAIIPIANEDEHNVGYDLIRHLISKKMIPQGRYYPVCKGHDYVFAERVSDSLQALKIWRRLGGSNIALENMNKSLFVKKDFMLRADDFIKLNGKVEINDGELSPFGMKIVSSLEKIHQEFFEGASGRSMNTRTLWVESARLFAHVEGFSFFRDLKDLKLKFLEASSNKDVKALEQIMLGHPSFKNTIHMHIKEAISKFEKDGDDDSIWVRDVSKVFGDIFIADKEFRRLGASY